MTSYSVADAKSRLSELIDRAARGEEVVITRHGAPVARLAPEGKGAPGPVTQADLDWLAERRVHGEKPIDAVALVRALRDESP